MNGRLDLTLGPLYFHWPAERIAAFYAEIADAAPVDRVYLGEVICGKRRPRIARALADAAERLQQAGKQVVWSSLALPATPADRAGDRALLGSGGDLVEINDVSGLHQLTAGRAFVAGPLLNVYNEAAADELTGLGCERLCANVEVSLDQIGRLHAARPGLEIELFAFGRLPLALSGRCYHARLHGRRKDACRYVCARDPDGIEVRTLEDRSFLAANGVQVLSHGVQLADTPLARLQAAGVRALRLSPHACDMVAVARAFRAYADGLAGPDALRRAAAAAWPGAQFVDGYVHGLPGWRRAAET